MTTKLRHPNSITDFEVGDEVVCLRSGAITQEGEHMIVSRVRTHRDGGWINFNRLDGSPVYRPNGLGTQGWSRFAIVVESATPNY